MIDGGHGGSTAPYHWACKLCRTPLKAGEVVDVPRTSEPEGVVVLCRPCVARLLDERDKTVKPPIVAPCHFCGATRTAVQALSCECPNCGDLVEREKREASRSPTYDGGNITLTRGELERRLWDIEHGIALMREMKGKMIVSPDIGAMQTCLDHFDKVQASMIRMLGDEAMPSAASVAVSTTTFACYDCHAPLHRNEVVTAPRKDPAGVDYLCASCSEKRNSVLAANDNYAVTREGEPLPPGWQREEIGATLLEGVVKAASFVASDLQTIACQIDDRDKALAIALGDLVTQLHRDVIERIQKGVRS